MAPLIPVPDDVARTASLALATRAERGGGTARSVVIATALTTGFATEHEIAELRDWHHRHPETTTLLAALYGGGSARATWTPLPLPSVPPEPTTAAMTPSKMRTKLARLSATVNRTDRQAALRIHSAATVALNEALRQANSKLAMKARTKTSQAALASARGVYGPAIYAALGVTEQELLDRRFDTFAIYAAGILAAAERRKLLAAATALGLDRAEVEERYGAEIDRRADAAAGFMVTALTVLATSALSGHAVTPETAKGEFSGPVPFGIVRNALAVAGGATAPTLDTGGPGPNAALDELSAKLTEIGSTLVDDLLTQAEVRVQMRSTWTTGDPTRPFEPHQALDGLSWVDTQPDELTADPGEFPYVDVYQPGDHDGCLCDLVTEYEPYEGDAGDLGGGELVGASAGGAAGGDTPE